MRIAARTRDSVLLGLDHRRACSAERIEQQIVFAKAESTNVLAHQMRRERLDETIPAMNRKIFLEHRVDGAAARLPRLQCLYLHVTAHCSQSSRSCNRYRSFSSKPSGNAAHRLKTKSFEFSRPHSTSSNSARRSLAASRAGSRLSDSAGAGARVRAVQKSSSTISRLDLPAASRRLTRFSFSPSNSLTVGPLIIW